MWNWQSSSRDPSSCAPPIQTTRSHWRRTREDRMDRGEDAQPFLLEVVLQALEDERRVGRVGFDDRDLAASRPSAAVFGVVGVADDTCRPGSPL